MLDNVLRLTPRALAASVTERPSGSRHSFFMISPSIAFQGAKITSDTGFLVMREVDRRFIKYPIVVWRPRLMTGGLRDIPIILCSNCYGRESIRWRQAMRTAMTASRSVGYFHVASAFPNLHAPRGVEFSPEPHPTLWGGGTRPSTAGKECVLETGEISLIDI